MPQDYSLKRLVSEKIDSDSLQKDRNDSVDDQLDDMLESFVKESKVRNMESIRRPHKRISEAETTFQTKPTGKQRKLEDIDVENFARRALELAESPQDSIEFKDTILRRARNRIMMSYDATVLSAFDKELQERHGVEIGKSDASKEEEFQAPRAAQAGPISGGAA